MHPIALTLNAVQLLGTDPETDLDGLTFAKDIYNRGYKCERSADRHYLIQQHDR